MGDTARICQFFLRGRCQRQKCEFRHPADLDKEKEKRPNGNDRPSTATDRETCKFFLSSGCKFGANCHFKHVGRERRRSRSRSRERRNRSESEDERRADSSDDEQERKKERRRRDEKDKESQRRKLRMEEKKKDPKRKESKTSVRERTEKMYDKRGVVQKYGTSKIIGSRTRSKSPVKKSLLVSEIKVSIMKPPPTKLETMDTNHNNNTPSPSSKPSSNSSKPSSNRPSSPLTESVCSKCGQKVDKRRVTN